MNNSIGDLIRNYEALASAFDGDKKTEFELSYYIPGASKVATALRKTRTISGQTIEVFIQNIPADQELAMHSRVWIENKLYHTPHVHFAHAEFDERLFTGLNSIKSWFGGTVHIFKSGSRLYGFHDIILDPGQWRRYMGKLLLCNRSGEPNFIDMPWVAHSLIKGFSATRISANSPNRQVPTFFLSF